MKMLAILFAVCGLGVAGPAMARDSGHHGGGGFSGHSHGWSGHVSSHSLGHHHRGFGHDHLSFDVGVGVGSPFEYGYYGPAYYDAVPYDYDYDYTAPPVYADGSSVTAEVQMALADRGYYHGDVDGEIGPMSQGAIARYQAHHGLSVTGVIDGALLSSLGIR